MKHLLFLGTLAIAVGFAHRAQASVNPTFSFRVARAPHPLPLDPSLADPAWQAGRVPESGAWENETTRTAAAYRTTAYLLYDDRNLYIGFDVEQHGTPVAASQSTNDIGFGLDDFVGMGIDTSGAGTQAYLFETTPRGTRYEQASENARYRPQWQAASQINAGGWRAVMIVPLDVIRIRSGSAQSWRIDFFRNVSAVAEHYTWAYNGVMQDIPAGQWPSFNDLRFWAGATGLDIHSTAAYVRPKPRAEAYALASAGSDRDMFQQNNGTFLPEQVRPLGIDVSYPVTPTINLVGTANPDFSNVEIDQQTIAPQEFPRQLLEYRPFFAQGASYINASAAAYSNLLTPTNEVFYSPSVGPFDWGAKVEGTSGLQSFGALTFRGFDEVTGNTFDDVAYGYKHALTDQTFQYWTDGVFAHHSIAGTDTTIEGGAKGRNLNTDLVWAVNTAVESGSWVPQGIAHSTNGYLDIHRPNYEAYIGYVDISPNYNPIDGFTSNSDIHGFQAFTNVLGSTKGLKTWDLQFVGDRFFDWSGAVHESDTGIFANATFKNGFSINGLGPTVGLLRQYDVVQGPNCTGPSTGTTFFTGFPCYRNGETLPFNQMTIPIGYRDGTPSPIDASAAWGNFGTNYLHLYTISTSRPVGHRLSLGLEYDGSYERDIMSGVLDSQWLRRLSLGFNTGSDSNVTLSLRSINGLGGFAPQPGVNLAAAFHARLRTSDLYINYGTPAANVTLDRFIVKWVVRAGGDAGT